MNELVHSLREKKETKHHETTVVPEKETLSKEDPVKVLQKIKEELYSLPNELKPHISYEKYKAISKSAEELIDLFLQKLKSFNLIKEDAFYAFEVDLKDTTRFEKKKLLKKFIKRKQVSLSPRQSEPLELSEQIEKAFKGDHTMFLACEFLVSAFYELFKEVNDYSELSILRNSDQVRNYFFHPNPFQSNPLIVGKFLEEANIRINNPFGQLAKELTVLTINVKFLLEEFVFDIMRKDSLPSETSPPVTQSTEQKTMKPCLRHFEVKFRGKPFSLDEVVISGNGDCGYSAMGISRENAAKLLLDNATNSEVRSLVADEIYDMFTTLPKEMIHAEDETHLYQHILHKERSIDLQLQPLLKDMNDLIMRPEGQRWNEEEILKHYSQEFSEKRLNEEQKKAYIDLKNLRAQREQLELKKGKYCQSEDAFGEYITFYIRPTVIDYLMKNGESNWLNTTSVKDRTSSADAIAYLLGYNLVILDEEGSIEHEYYSSDISIENTIFLLHIGNWHFNKLEIS